MSLVRIEFPQSPLNTSGLTSTQIAEFKRQQRSQIAVGLIAGVANSAGFGYTWEYLAGYAFVSTTSNATAWTRA